MPNLYVIAGPNGAGKTTSAYYLISANIPIINSDEIAAAVQKAGIVQTNLQEFSNLEAVRMMMNYLEKKESFAVETNLADIATWKFLIETQKTGYAIHIIFVSTDDIELLNSRIDQRALSGEHYVRPDVVRERYINGLNLLSHYFDFPDTIQLFDNSYLPKLHAEIHKGQIVSQKKKVADWVNQCISKHLDQKIKKQKKNISDLDSIAEVKKAYQQKKGRGSGI